MRIILFERATLLLISALLLIACSSNSPAFLSPYKVEFNVIPTDDINIYSDDEARPVKVRVYQLNEIGPFKNADFLSLYNKDREILADSLIDVVTLPPVIPGVAQKLSLDIQQEARYLAVLVEFANYETTTTKSFIGLVEDPDEHSVFIRITSTKIELTQPVESAWWQIF
ncbi:type VI secretion system lipoprotein TssJ [Marinomonas sp. 15G1-11]|uniref:Type VI secretion system lipoprotein TssJ n=1 Tax=Marinomonas phaeophyticola TaxID=3004091 RepID=A0ABT4JR48_9GAMM|nr:type VI secretion system lipoprotein TssJ [Marinomonas sp. 15G1-11]MCZ2720867.1 type VI secretion system lipoprotein TssJ [Marinomonas sp. 15G1-11]